MVVSILKRMAHIFSLNGPKQANGSGNDNDNNRPNNSNGPPDLEELWKDFNQKLNAMFGGKGAGNAGNGPAPDSNGAKWGASLIVVIVVFLWLVSGCFLVQEGQTGVVMTFGKYSHDTTSGFNWRLPYPIQSHEIVNVSQVRTVEVGYQGNVKNKQPKEALMLTDDSILPLFKMVFLDNFVISITSGILRINSLFLLSIFSDTFYPILIC